MDGRVDERSMVVERLGRGRAVVMTADGVFREVKLSGRLARRGDEAIGHELGALKPRPLSLRLPRLVSTKRLGWAATAAVCVGLVLGSPVRGWLDPFAGPHRAPQEYRLTATIHNPSLRDIGSSPVGLSSVGDLPRTVAASSVPERFVLRPVHANVTATSIVSRDTRTAARRGDAVAEAGRSSTLDFAPVKAVRLRAGTGRTVPVRLSAPRRQPSQGWASYAGR